MRAILTALLLIAAGPALAMTCTYPKSCAEVMYGSYEVGEAGSVSNHVKFTCRRESGQVSTYIAWIVNGWGLLGLNRVGASGMQIDFEKGTSEKLVCK